MSDEAVAVFTARSPQRILREGGSQAWALDPVRARKCKYLICCQNQHNADRDFSDASEPHGTLFLVGKIRDVVPASDDDAGGRWRIEISEYCVHRVPDAWQGWRNPVRYTTLKEMGVNPAELQFHDVSDVQADLGGPLRANPAQATKMAGDSSAAPLSIAAAKGGLSAFYGVGLDAIEIIIRG